MTGTPFCMLPVTSINNLPIANGKVGPIFNRLISRWGANCGVDIPNQIKSWNNDENKKSNSPTPYNFK